MGKEIIVPWSCETGDKIKLILGVLFLVTGIISLVMFGINGIPNPDVYHGILFVYGLLATATGGAILLVELVEQDLYPSFRCKPRGSIT